MNKLQDLLASGKRMMQLTQGLLAAPDLGYPAAFRDLLTPPEVRLVRMMRVALASESTERPTNAAEPRPAESPPQPVTFSSELAAIPRAQPVNWTLAQPASDSTADELTSDTVTIPLGLLQTLVDLRIAPRLNLPSPAMPDRRTVSPTLADPVQLARDILVSPAALTAHTPAVDLSETQPMPPAAVVFPEQPFPANRDLDWRPNRLAYTANAVLPDSALASNTTPTPTEISRPERAEYVYQQADLPATSISVPPLAAMPSADLQAMALAVPQQQNPAIFTEREIASSATDALTMPEPPPVASRLVKGVGGLANILRANLSAPDAPHSEFTPPLEQFALPANQSQPLTAPDTISSAAPAEHAAPVMPEQASPEWPNVSTPALNHARLPAPVELADGDVEHLIERLTEYLEYEYLRMYGTSGGR